MTIEIHGFFEPGYQPLYDAFRANFDEGLEVGASLAVTRHGRPVVDLWAGHKDAARTQPWERDTIVRVYSTTKIPLIMSFLTLIDRGLVNLDTTVASYWPEFGAGGKERVTIREVLTHRGGVPGFDPPVRLLDLCNWDATIAHIAAQRHWYDGRPVLCYNAISGGFVLGEIMRRVDGRKPAQYFREQIAASAGIDFQMALDSRAEVARVAELVELKPPGKLVTAIADPRAERAYNSVVVRRDEWSDWKCRSSEIPAANGCGNARSIARLAAICACNGELDGQRYLSRAILDQATSLQVEDVDPFLGPIRLGLGFGLDGPEFPAPTPTSFHWGGYGGSWVIMDRPTGISCGYAMNGLVVPDEVLGDRRQARLWQTLGDVMNVL